MSSWNKSIREAVLDGMSLLQWTWSAEDWRAHQRQRRYGLLYTVAESRGLLPSGPPTAVVMTATGLLYGNRAWLWRWLDPRVTPAVAATVLQVQFNQPWRRRELVQIPVPSALEPDVKELATHLRERLSKASHDAPKHQRLPRC